MHNLELAEKIAATMPVCVVGGSIRAATCLVEECYPDISEDLREDVICEVIKRARHYLSQTTEAA